jgi:hypothetical protein
MPVAALTASFAPAFYRREPKVRARAYLLGLVSGLERKNGWTLAEFAEEATPDGMRRLLAAARWGADVVRDALARYAAARLGSDRGVLVADETGFLRPGRARGRAAAGQPDDVATRPAGHGHYQRRQAPQPITARPVAAIRPACGAPTTATPDRPADQAASDAGKPRQSG